MIVWQSPEEARICAEELEDFLRLFDELAPLAREVLDRHMRAEGCGSCDEFREALVSKIEAAKCIEGLCLPEQLT